MSSVIEPQLRKAELETKAAMSGRTVVQPKKKSLPRHFERAPREKATLLPQAPRGAIAAKFQDKAKGHQVVKRSSVPAIPLKSSKPWPGSGSNSASSTDELIKHMSNVPSYLQRTMHNNGDNIQGKALNFGVLEWGDLERYTGKKQHSACGTTKVASLISSQSSASTPKQQQATNPYTRSISQRKSKDGTINGEESCSERGREGNKCLASNMSPLSGWQKEKIQRGFLGELFDDIQVKDQCTRVPYSFPLPRKDSDICTTTGCSGSGGNNSSLPRENRQAVSRGLTSHKQNTNELTPSCSLVEPPLVASREKMSNVETTERGAASSKRGRQSPLRRMLDPLLGPRNVVRASHHESTPVGLHRPLSSSFSSNNKKKECQTCPGTCTENSASIASPSFQPSNGNLQFQPVEKIQPLTRHALLQLSWKRGLPVFMLSSGESDILGATVRSKYISDTIDNSEFLYSIFTLQESKIKGGAVWIRSRNKGKKQQHLISNVIAEVRVSTSKSKCCNNSFREFVLVGPQLVPAASKERAIHEIEMESPVNMELAAIVIGPSTNGCLCSKTGSAGSLTAILPSGIHGASARGEPSPLIERWRSGGECDCGGWDEGCRLTILNSEGSKSNWEETQAHLELYPLKHLTQQEKTSEATNGGPPTSYMQCHPPLSPVGRA
ncbi:hypothetical protein FCM35_KLT19463 [Carex littledalei]|uniref:Uncharacterized protein n=1 Tax=Carex littledalei TaxID=544730 RepID=A0A833RDY1_9POAL|nr:hypothetical protein FCM35_KLT19463 [Carex littledalei]